MPEMIPYVRAPRRLPVVLSGEEVVRFLEAVHWVRPLAGPMAGSAQTAVCPGPALCGGAAIVRGGGAAMRRHRQQPRHHPHRPRQEPAPPRESGGKAGGGKERQALLSPRLLAILRAYRLVVRPAQWLFPGRDARRPISPKMLGRR